MDFQCPFNDQFGLSSQFVFFVVIFVLWRYVLFKAVPYWVETPPHPIHPNILGPPPNIQYPILYWVPSLAICHKQYSPRPSHANYMSSLYDLRWEYICVLHLCTHTRDYMLTCITLSWCCHRSFQQRVEDLSPRLLCATYAITIIQSKKHHFFLENPSL